MLATGLHSRTPGNQRPRQLCGAVRAPCTALASMELKSCWSSATSASAIFVFTCCPTNFVKLVLQTTLPVLPAITRQPGFLWFSCVERLMISSHWCVPPSRSRKTLALWLYSRRPGRPRSCRTMGRRRCLPRTALARGQVVGAHNVPRVRRQGVAVYTYSRGVRGQDHAAEEAAALAPAAGKVAAQRRRQTSTAFRS